MLVETFLKIYYKQQKTIEINQKINYNIVKFRKEFFKMKNFKKIVSTILAAIMMVSAFACMPATAAESTEVKEGKIYFEVPDDWTDIKNVFCHIWAVDGSGKWPAWAAKAERADLVEGNLYSYDISKLPTALDSSKGVAYAIIFAAKKTDNTQIQTYNTLMSTDCIGDTVYCTGVVFENPEDSEQVCIESAWRNHPELGAEKKITSSGKIVGKAHAEGGSDATMLATYIVAYVDDDAKLEKVPSLMAELKLTADEVYAACVARYDANGDEEKDVKLAKIKTLLDSVPVSTPDDPKPTEPVPTEPNPTEPSATVLGDVDGDGDVKIKDVTMIQRAAAFIVELTETQAKAADVNADTKVNVNDATAIQRYVAGIDTGFAIGK